MVQVSLFSPVYSWCIAKNICSTQLCKSLINLHLEYNLSCLFSIVFCYLNPGMVLTLTVIHLVCVGSKLFRAITLYIVYFPLNVASCVYRLHRTWCLYFLTIITHKYCWSYRHSCQLFKMECWDRPPTKGTSITAPIFTFIIAFWQVESTSTVTHHLPC